MKRLISMLLVITMVAGCASMRPVDTSNWATTASQVHAGDTVKVTTRDGRTSQFVVTEVTGDAIVGQSASIPRSDIAALQVEKKSQSSGKSGRTALTVVGILALIAIALSGGGGGGSGGGSGGY